MQECHRSHAFLETNLYLGKFCSFDYVFTHLPTNCVTFHCLEANFTNVLCVHEKWDFNLHYGWLCLVSNTRALVTTSSTTFGVFSLQLFLVTIIFSLVYLAHKIICLQVPCAKMESLKYKAFLCARFILLRKQHA